MYTSTVVVAALYLAGMVIVLLLSCCVSMTTCDCVKIATPSAYAGDFFILVGIFWQAAAQGLETPQDLEADTDAAAENLLLLALASSLYVVFANSIRAVSVTLFACLVLLRTAAAAVLVWVLVDDATTDAPVTIIMILGVVVVGTFPWLKLRTPKTLDV